MNYRNTDRKIIQITNVENMWARFFEQQEDFTKIYYLPIIGFALYEENNSQNIEALVVSTEFGQIEFYDLMPCSGDGEIEWSRERPEDETFGHIE